ncbi:MAG TPA: hypothetical protein VLB82_10805 [Thermodesulfobacteriota bacterium]|nr:hypothetical protein [Thermodesulfobacteriota bacterium]
MEKDYLINSITQAFSEITYPGDDDLTVHPLGLDEDFYDSIKGKTWQQLDSQLLRYHHDCIGVLTARGFQYYIAAFLIEDLKSGSPITDQMFWIFSQAVIEDRSPIIGISGKAWFDERISMLTPDQKSCLVWYFTNIKEEQTEDDCAAIDIVIEKIKEIK